MQSPQRARAGWDLGWPWSDDKPGRWPYSRPPSGTGMGQLCGEEKKLEGKAGEPGSFFRAPGHGGHRPG